jgi:hypothetical protein
MDHYLENPLVTLLLCFVAAALIMPASSIAKAAEVAASSSLPTGIPLSEPNRNPCPPGHKAEFKFGDTSLFVDPSWLSIGSMNKLRKIAGGACPTKPLQDVSISFYEFDLHGAMRTYWVNHHLPFQIRIYKLASPQWGNGIPSTPETRQKFSMGTVEDITSKGLRASASEKLYRLDPFHGEPFAIDCAGAAGQPAGRTCVCTFDFNKDIQVYYFFDQSKPANDRTQHAVPEPEGFFQIHEQVRAFITNQLRVEQGEHPRKER